MMMRERSIPLGKILGIPIGLDYSWFLFFGLITWSLATGYYPQRYAEWPGALFWLMGAVTAIGLFGSVLLHELGHSVAAQYYHIPVRRIRLMIFGGVAELSDDPPHAGAEFLIALAGPFVSVILAGLLGVTWAVLAFFAPIPALEPLQALIGYLAIINLILAGFNLLPGFPLDGGRVFRSVVWGLTGDLARATAIAAGVGRVVSFGFIGVGVLQAFTGSLFNGLWTAFIGMFLFSAASAEVQVQRMRAVLSQRTVAQAMRRQYPTIPGDVTLLQLVNSHILGSGWRSFLVIGDGGQVGTLNAVQVRAVPRQEWPFVTAADVMVPVDENRQVGPDTGLWTALKQMDGSGVDELTVVEDGRIYGLLRREDVFGYLRTVLQFGA